MEVSKEFNKDLEEIKKSLKKLTDFFGKVNDLTEEIWIDDGLEDISKEITQEKLTKKQRREKALNFLKERFPQINKEFDELDSFIQGIGLRITDLNSSLEEKLDDLEDAERLIEEVEDKKNSL